jgi:hypothetical protein
LVEQEAEMSSISFTVRLRFHVRTKLQIAKDSEELVIAGHGAQLFGDGRPIAESDRLTLYAKGFPTEAEAGDFGRKLRTTLLLTAVEMGFPVSVGEDRVTFSTSGVVKKLVLEKTGGILRDDIHGLDVYEDDGTVSVLSASGTAITSMAPSVIFAEIDSRMSTAPSLEPKVATALLMLADALSALEPLAKAVLAVSAVELLAQGYSWDVHQNALILAAAKHAGADNSVQLAEEDRRAVVDAIERAYKVGVTEGIRRLLSRLNLDELKADWKTVYARRSQIFHGISPLPRSGDVDFASKALELSKQIVLAAVASSSASPTE